MLLWLAQRLIISPYTNRATKIMLIISMTSIAIACGALALSWSIMRGFEEVTLKNLQSIHAPLIMESSTGAGLNFPAIQQVLKQEFPEISACTPKTTQQIIMATQEQQLSPALTLMGIDPELEYLVTNLNRQIIIPNYKFIKNKAKNNLKILNLLANHVPDQILIGAELARNYNLNIGDQVELLVPNQANPLTCSMKFELYTATIGAIFKTGVNDLDQNLVICNLDFLKILFPDSRITQIGLQTNSQNLELLRKLKARFKLNIFPWQELYAPIVSALKLEKYVMGLILLLITIITSFTIIALMFMLVTQRTHEIAILQVLGLSTFKIKQLFMLIGLTIVTSATVVGLTIAYILGHLLERYPIITLPEVYLINTLPIKLEFIVFLTIFGLSLILGLIATWLPAKQVKYLQIATILKQRI